MGSLISPPKVPKYIPPAPQTVSLPPATLTAEDIAKENAAKLAAQEQKNKEEAQAVKEAEREKKEQENLLTRARRGRISTIKTSFRGLLETNQKTPERKSLLGE